MRTIFAFLLLLTCSTFFAQETKTVGVEVAAADNNQLQILNTYPDAYPTVSVVFKAEQNGQPVWDLAVEDIDVFEDGQACEIVSLEPVSKQKAIHISLVLDHSGSMEIDYAQLYKDGDWSQPLGSYGKNGIPTYPPNYITPLERAKRSIQNFITSFDLMKDYLSLTAFSTTIDTRIAPTQDTALIRAVLDTLQPTASTALYDAAIAGIQQVENQEGILVEVLLTDGADNASLYSAQQVIDEALANEIPIFVIGLGNVNVDTLSRIATATNGEFFYANRATALDSIYLQISRKILSFYDLRYESTHLRSLTTNRRIQLDFRTPDGVLSDTTNVQLPAEVVTYVAKKERDQQYRIYGGVLTLLLLTSGVLLATYRAKKERGEVPLVIKRIYPNPSAGVINVIHNADTGFLVGRRLSGQEVFRHTITSKHETIDLRDHSGVVIVVVESNEGVSNVVQVVIQ